MCIIRTVHGNSAISVKILTVMRRKNLEWRYPDLRAPYWRFYWNFSGTAQITLPDRRVELRPRTGYLIAPETRFSGRGERLDHFYVHFTLPYEIRSRDGAVHAVPGSREIESLVTGLAECLPAGSERQIEHGAPPAIGAAASVGAAGLVLCALSRIPLEAGTVPVTDPFVRAAVQAISSDPGRFVRSDQIAQQAGCDERTLRRRFAAAMQTTPLQFALRRRIEHSCMLLHFTDRSIEEIAEQTGFCDRHHFSKVFRAHRGIGPAGFRAISDQLPLETARSQ